MTEQKGSVEADNTTDDTPSFNDHSEFVYSETDEQFNPLPGQGSEQLIVSYSEKPASHAADRSEA